MFLCNYSDVNHGGNFHCKFDCLGLIKTTKLKDYYFNFFNMLREYYPGVPIIYYHFPTILGPKA